MTTTAPPTAATAGPDPALAPLDVGELDQPSEIAAAMITLVKLHAGIRARVAGPDGDLSPLFLLVRIAHQGPSRAGELADQLCADPSTVSRQVASLVRSGLLERRADPDDGRASILVPTELGRQRVIEHAQRRGATVWPVIKDWSQQDRDDLLRLVRRYTAGVEARRDEIIASLAAAAGSTTRPAAGADAAAVPVGRAAAVPADSAGAAAGPPTNAPKGD